jgi:hypothetical protein
MMLPPAPAPSFAKPCEYALIPSNCEISNFGFTVNIGISET